MTSRKIITFIICIAIPLAIGGISGFITAGETEGWFTTVNKPSFNPPNSVFGPVWTILYILMGISLYMIWESPASELRKRALWVFALQLFLNFMWSIVFFSWHALFLAIIDIVVLWVLILNMIIVFRKIKPAAGYLNIPYIFWVSFATALTVSIWWLNK